MNTTKGRRNYYLQTRTADRSWDVVANWGTESTAIRHLGKLAEVSYPHVTLRIMTGNPFSGEVESVVATRQGCRTD